MSDSAARTASRTASRTEPGTAPRTAPRTAPFGSWQSPISAASLASSGVGISEPHVDGGAVFWLESRPSDGGRVVVVRRGPGGDARDLTAAPFNVRSRVHEYGGGAFDVAAGVLVFCHFDDRRVYRLDVAADGSAAGQPRPITPAGDLRYGGLRLVGGDGTAQALLAVCEDHGTGADQPVNRLVRLDLDGPNDAGGQVLVSGPDFVTSPALSQDGSRLAWVQWDHPNMPWDDTSLCVADLDADWRLGRTRVVAGGPGEAAIDPVWAPDGRLLLLSDRTGWWNLYAADLPSDPAADPDLQALWPADLEFGGPAWSLGRSFFAIDASGTIACAWTEDGYEHLARIDTGSGELLEVPLTLASVRSSLVWDDGQLVLVAAFVDAPDALVRVRPDDGAVEVLRRSTTAEYPPDLLSVAEPVSWTNGAGLLVHGFYYPPRNPAFTAPEGELPPLMTLSHGGPTGMSSPGLEPGLQYWTSRGIAVLHVNYGGSTGYGRAYRERLRGGWGIVDVDDCATGALAMVSTGRADARRLAIKGGSAGGYTTLAALAFTDVFTVGSSWFGIGDLETLARDTHKFESRYCDRLIGPYPEARDVYRERSPINHVDRISCPVILFQGADDQVVPRSQAEDMAAAVRAKGLPVALLVFEGEGHGFRRSEHVIRALDAETYFFGKVFGFDLADDVEPVEIANL